MALRAPATTTRMPTTTAMAARRGTLTGGMATPPGSGATMPRLPARRRDHAWTLGVAPDADLPLPRRAPAGRPPAGGDAAGRVPRRLPARGDRRGGSVARGRRRHPLVPRSLVVRAHLRA